MPEPGSALRNKVARRIPNSPTNPCTRPVIAVHVLESAVFRLHPTSPRLSDGGRSTQANTFPSEISKFFRQFHAAGGMSSLFAGGQIKDQIIDVDDGKQIALRQFLHI